MTRVLIVDDNEANRYLLRALLQGHGCAVEAAAHGAEALALARRTPPDLVISDLLMPVMDGYTLLRHWKADDRLKAVPFMVYTATYTDPRDERLALDLGADAFLVKPAEPEPFMACVGAALERQRSAAQPGRAPQLDESVLLAEYNQALVRKLEQKAAQLERTNGDLLAEIAESKRMEAALRASEDRWRSLFHSIADPVVVYDRATLAFLAVNDAAVASYGYSRAEFEAMTVKDLQPARDPPGGGRHRKKNGAVIDVETASCDVDFAGRPACMVQARDVTERRRLEEQLRQSQKMEAVGRLAGGVAHDFNNLLTIISGYSDLLLAMPEVPPTARQPVKAISEAGARAAALTRQLLGFSRQTILQPVVLDVNAVIVEMEKMLRRLIGEDILFATVLAPNLSRVRVDPAQLDQVLMNLAVNARDAMPRGGRLTVETADVSLGADYAAAHPDCKAGRYVMLAMTDSGCGMTAAVKARIFEPFFTTKPVGKGTGLGLAMVFGIVQQSGGWIHVYSEPGLGTTFKIYLPPVAETVKKTGGSAVGVAARGTETILMVEDEEAVRGLALLSLQMHGYQVLAAADGGEALHILEAHCGAVDLVLSDVVMPVLSGPELVRALRARHPRLKVLFMSGYTDDAVVRHGLLEAEVAFIQKPFTPLDLARKVRQLLDEQPASAKAGA